MHTVRHTVGARAHDDVILPSTIRMTSSYALSMYVCMTVFSSVQSYLSTHVHITDNLLLKRQSGYNYYILQIPDLVQNNPSLNSFCLDLHVVGCQVEKLLPSDHCYGMLLAERLKLSAFFFFLCVCVCMCVCLFFVFCFVLFCFVFCFFGIIR